MTTSTVSLPIIAFVQADELTTPRLSEAEQHKLWAVLNMGVSVQNMRALALQTETGHLGVFVSCLYAKQTDAKPRLEGSDYQGILGVDCRAQFGPLVKVFRRKDDGAVRFTIWSIARQNYTTIIPEGLEAFNFGPVGVFLPGAQ